MTKHPRHFAFIDVETTGLNPVLDSIVEIGCVITDFDLKPVGEPFHAIIGTHPDEWMDPVAKEMHVASGLYGESVARFNDPGANLSPSMTVRRLSDYIKASAGGVIHVGLKPDFDASFLDANNAWPDDVIDFKRIDVLGLRRTVRSCIGEHALPPIYKPGHRVLTDIQHCMDEFRYYIGMFKDGFCSA